jgi:hypothetical protein
VVTRDAVRADLDLEDEERFVVGGPLDEPEARSDCTSLASGSLSVHESPRYWPAEAGDAMLLQTLSEGYVLWTLDGAGKGDCAWTRAGEIEAPAPGVSNEAVPHRSGKVARVGVTPAEEGVVAVSSVGGGASQMLGMLPGLELADATWLDPQGRYLVAIVRPGMEGEDGIALFDLDNPLSVLTFPSSVFDGAHTLGEVAVGKLGAQPQLVVTAGSFPSRVYRVDLPASLESLFADPPRASAVVEDGVEAEDGLPVAIALDTNRLTVEALTHEGRAFDVVVSPDGGQVALALADGGLDERSPGDSEIVLVPITGGSMRLLTRNDLRDYEPRFTSDGAHILFKTRVEIPKTQWRITAARRVSPNP